MKNQNLSLSLFEAIILSVLVEDRFRVAWRIRHSVPSVGRDLRSYILLLRKIRAVVDNS